MNNLAKRAIYPHYFDKANPFKSVDSLNQLLDENLFVTNNPNIAILNKPPGFVLQGWLAIGFGKSNNLLNKAF